MKIINVVGARPNLVKIAPLLRAMRRQERVEPLLIHTGQHYDKKLSDIFFQQMKISEPDFNLDVGSGSQAWQTAEILKRIEPLLVDHRPDLVLVVGDVNSVWLKTLKMSARTSNRAPSPITLALGILNPLVMLALKFWKLGPVKRPRSMARPGGGVMWVVVKAVFVPTAV